VYLNVCVIGCLRLFSCLYVCLFVRTYMYIYTYIYMCVCIYIFRSVTLSLSSSSLFLPLPLSLPVFLCLGFSAPLSVSVSILLCIIYDIQIFGYMFRHVFFFEHIELPAKLLDYFLQSNKSNINQFTVLKINLSRYCTWDFAAASVQRPNATILCAFRVALPPNALLFETHALIEIGM